MGGGLGAVLLLNGFVGELNLEGGEALFDGNIKELCSSRTDESTSSGEGVLCLFSLERLVAVVNF